MNEKETAKECIKQNVLRNIKLGKCYGNKKGR